ncbi:hypothetical protein Ae717Ps2_6634 [Pseudonocardia sp. Ae717_Ps2]|nr:hypothetical protein Ae717Ps2_6634 [Pseudonocardia sp. Ae717_Ps2]
MSSCRRATLVASRPERPLHPRQVPIAREARRQRRPRRQVDGARPATRRNCLPRTALPTFCAPLRPHLLTIHSSCIPPDTSSTHLFRHTSCTTHLSTSKTQHLHFHYLLLLPHTYA